MTIHTSAKPSLEPLAGSMPHRSLLFLVLIQPLKWGFQKKKSQCKITTFSHEAKHRNRNVSHPEPCHPVGHTHLIPNLFCVDKRGTVGHKLILLARACTFVVWLGLVSFLFFLFRRYYFRFMFSLLFLFLSLVSFLRQDLANLVYLWTHYLVKASLSSALLPCLGLLSARIIGISHHI